MRSVPAARLVESCSAPLSQSGRSLIALRQSERLQGSAGNDCGLPEDRTIFTLRCGASNDRWRIAAGSGDFSSRAARSGERGLGGGARLPVGARCIRVKRLPSCTRSSRQRGSECWRWHQAMSAGAGCVCHALSSISAGCNYERFTASSTARTGPRTRDHGSSKTTTTASIVTKACRLHPCRAWMPMLA